jgi:hypothetical protein
MSDIKTYLDKFSRRIDDSSIAVEWEQFGNSLHEPLLNFLRSGTSYEKYHATDVIRQMYFLGKHRQWILEHAFDPMLHNLQDENEYTRGISVAVLADFRDKRALEPIISLAHDVSDYVRWVVTWSLSRFDDKRAIPALEWIRDNDDSWQNVRDDDEEIGYRKEFNRGAAIKVLDGLTKIYKQD